MQYLYIISIVIISEVNSNYFNYFDIINLDVHAFSQGHIMDIATKPVERCNTVGSTLGIT